MLEGDYEDAEKYLDKCLKSDKTNSDAIYLLAELYDTQQRYDDELSLLTQAVQDSAHEATLRFIAGYSKYMSYRTGWTRLLT